MASLSTRVADLALRIATELKSLRTLINGNATDLSALTTSAKGNLVLAINEVGAAVIAEQAARAGLIDDTSASSTSRTRSSSKIDSLIAAAVANVVGGSPALLDSLHELADAIGDDPSFATTMGTALGNRLRLDAAQTLTGAQQTQGRSNLDVYGTTQIGNPDVDLVAVLNAGLS